MKKILLAILLFSFGAATQAQVQFEALTFTPQFPKAGQNIKFTYNKRLSSLIDEKKIELVVYLLDGAEYTVAEPKLTQAGTIFSGSFTLPDKAKSFAFAFSSGKEKDANGGKGYFIPVYNNKNEPVTDYYSTLYNIQRFYGEDYFGISFNAQKMYSMFEAAAKQYPELKKDPGFFNNYLYSLNGAKKGVAIPEIQDALQQLENKGNLSEKEYNILVQWYGRDKRKGKVDSLNAAMKAAFPEGEWKKNEIPTKFFAEKDLAKKIVLYKEYMAQYPPAEDNKRTIENMRWQLAITNSKAKDYPAYYEWNGQLSKSMQASNNNDIAWAMSEANDNIAEAKKMSLAAVTYAKNEMQHPSEKKPETATAKQWEGNRKFQYAAYADTYAFILYLTGDYKTGLQYAKDAAAIGKNKNADYNERYSMLAEKVLPAATVKKELEQFVKEGGGTSKIKAILKTLYLAEKKSDAGYDEYITQLEMAASINKKAALAKNMTNEPAPKFSLKDMEGNDISLEGLKGKVVIVDFWATWCGPCIASMPAMKTAQEKLQPRGDVAFVFVDTWQTEEDKKQNAADFLKKNNYPFHVLLDNDDKVVSDFKVNGIPTKFVIDKTGNIRFKSVGFGGNADALIEELSTMVELAATDVPPVKRYVK